MKLKRILAGTAAAVIAVTAFSGCGKGSSSSGDSSTGKDPSGAETPEQGKVLNIYCWNTEFQERFEKFYVPNADKSVYDGVKINWIQTTNEGNLYQTKLDEALKNQQTAVADDKIDIFLVEMDYAAKYVNSDVAVPLADLGITSDDLKNQYEYTKQTFTNPDGKQVATTWQATPGLYMYRADIAEEVLGTSDPDKVQEQISDLDKFTEVAAKMKEKGYYMVSGYDDMYRLFSNNVSAPWVTGNKITIDDQIAKWIELTKEYSDKGYNHATSLWDDQWSADMKKDANVFGYFFSTWGIAFSLRDATVDQKIKDDGSNAKEGNGLYGQWRACPGPVSYSWGGTGIVACQGTDNEALIKDIMLKLTCDTEIMKSMTADETVQDYTNNKEAIKQLIDEGYTNPFLGGQNHLALLTEAAEKLDMSNKLSAYDQGLNEKLQSNMKLYFNGQKTYEEALKLFYSDIKSLYPNLTH